MGDKESMNEESKDMKGIQLYKPGVVAAYLALGGIPVGLFLYGLNIVRRGQRWLGGTLCTLAGIAFIMIIVSASLGGRRLSGFGILGVLVAIWVYNIERKPYRLALQQGATPAKWWPPLFWVFGGILIVVFVATFFGPGDVSGTP